MAVSLSLANLARVKSEGAIATIGESECSGRAKPNGWFIPRGGLT